jgi:hypothetical protein
MFIARGMNQDATVVVGLATEEYEQNSGFSVDAAVYYKEFWTKADQIEMEALQEASRAFVSPILAESREDEYPPEGHRA